MMMTMASFSKRFVSRRLFDKFCLEICNSYSLKAYKNIITHVRTSEGWYLDVDIEGLPLYTMSSLSAFWAGVQVLVGDVYEVYYHQCVLLINHSGTLPNTEIRGIGIPCLVSARTT